MRTPWRASFERHVQVPSVEFGHRRGSWAHRLPLQSTGDCSAVSVGAAPAVRLLWPCPGTAQTAQSFDMMPLDNAWTTGADVVDNRHTTVDTSPASVDEARTSVECPNHHI